MQARQWLQGLLGLTLLVLAHLYALAELVQNEPPRGTFVGRSTRAVRSSRSPTPECGLSTSATQRGCPPHALPMPRSRSHRAGNPMTLPVPIPSEKFGRCVPTRRDASPFAGSLQEPMSSLPNREPIISTITIYPEPLRWPFPTDSGSSRGST